MAAAMSAPPADNMGFSGDHVISMDLRTNAAQAASEVGVVNDLLKDLIRNQEIYANISNSSANAIVPLAQAARTRGDVDLERELLEARKKLLEISKEETDQVHRRRVDTEKLIEVTEALNRVTGGHVTLQLPNQPDILKAEALKPFAHIERTTQALAGTSLEDAHLRTTSAMAALGRGDLSEGILQTHRALASMGGESELTTTAQKKAFKSLRGMYDALKAEADHVTGGGGAAAPGGAATSSFAQRALERLNPDVFGEKALESSRARIMRMVPQHLPGGSSGAMGQAFRAISPEMLESIGGAVIPLAAAGMAAKVGYDQYVRIGKEQQELRGLTGQAGAGDVMKYDVQARVMSLSPFISDQQARQTIQAALREGYKGDTADNAIDFAIDNFRRFNMSIGDSMKVYRANVIEAGASTEQTAASLGVLAREVSKSSMSMGDATQQFTKNSERLAGMGAGVATPEISRALTMALSQDPKLHGVDLGAMLDSRQGQLVMALQMHTDIRHLPGALHAAQAHPEVTIEQFFNGVKQILLKRGFREGETEEELWGNVASLLYILSQFGAPITTADQAVALGLKILGSGLMAERYAQEEIASKPQHIGFWGAREAGLSTNWKAAQKLNPFQGAASRRRENIQEMYLSDVKAQHGESMPLLSQFFRDRNVGDVRVQYKGKVMPLEDFLQHYGYEGFKALQDNDAKVAMNKDAQGRRVSHLDFQTVAQSEAPGYAAARGALGVPSGSAGFRYEIDLSNDAKKLLQLVRKNGVSNAVVAESSLSGRDQTNNESQ